MNTVTLEVASRDGVSKRAIAAFKGRSQGARLSFATPELLWKVMTAKRWALLKTMSGQGAMTLREVARRVNRDVKAVHTDAHALLDAGVIRTSENGKLIFPFDSLKVEFELRAA